MAIRMERSGELMLIRGAPDKPEKPKKKKIKFIELGLWLALVALLSAVLFGRPDMLAWPAISHTIKSFLAAAL